LAPVSRSEHPSQATYRFESLEDLLGPGPAARFFGGCSRLLDISGVAFCVDTAVCDAASIA